MSTEISKVSSSEAVQYEKARTEGGLTKNDFLKLLTTQLQYQDPMNPASEQEMAGTLAQFTSLEQTQQMSQVLEAMAKTNQWSQGLSLLGKTVQGTAADGSAVNGVVTGMSFVKNELNLQVGTQTLALSQLTKVTA